MIPVVVGSSPIGHPTKYRRSGGFRVFGWMLYGQILSKRSQFVCVLGQVARCKVRVALHHLRTCPPAQFLQDIDRRSTHRVPACPRVPQIMPAEIIQSGPLACSEPCRPDSVDLLTSPGEDESRIYPLASLKDGHCLIVERQRDRLACLGLIGVNPCLPRVHVDL